MQLQSLGFNAQIYCSVIISLGIGFFAQHGIDRCSTRECLAIPGVVPDRLVEILDSPLELAKVSVCRASLIIGHGKSKPLGLIHVQGLKIIMPIGYAPPVIRGPYVSTRRYSAITHKTNGLI